MRWPHHTNTQTHISACTCQQIYLYVSILILCRNYFKPTVGPHLLSNILMTKLPHRNCQAALHSLTKSAYICVCVCVCVSVRARCHLCCHFILEIMKVLYSHNDSMQASVVIFSVLLLHFSYALSALLDVGWLTVNDFLCWRLLLPQLCLFGFS